jgi:CheY-like chemotaxis protein
MPADVKEAMDAGATFYLTKPVGFRELQDAAAKALPPA